MTEAKSKQQKSGKVTSGTFIIESARAPNEMAPRTSAFTSTRQQHSEEHHTTTKQRTTEVFDSSTFTRSRTKGRLKMSDNEALHRSVMKSEHEHVSTGGVSPRILLDDSAGVPAADNISEAGTYTIEGEEENKEENTARQSIDTVFGVSSSSSSSIMVQSDAPLARRSSSQQEQEQEEQDEDQVFR